MPNSGEHSMYAFFGLVLSAIFLLVLTRLPRITFHGCLPILARARSISSFKTTRRSPSPERKVPANATPPADYKDILPPSSREFLAKAAESLSQLQKEKLQGHKVDDVEVMKRVISFEADYRKCGPSTFTPTGISIEEVKALGDFPSYAELSSVPLPDAYVEFDINTALPRPYRPFRWAYHQTMCTLSYPVKRNLVTDTRG